MNDRKFFLFVYAVSISTGLLQMATLFLLEKQLLAAEFSRVSFLLSLFSLYLPFVDLGIQPVLMSSLQERHRAAGPQPDHGLSHDAPTRLFASSLCLRLGGALIGIPALAIQCFLGNADHATLWGGLCFIISLIPSAYFLHIEALGFSLRNPWLACLLRLSRNATLFLFLAVVFLWLPKRTELTPEHYGTLFAIFPIVFFSVIFILPKITKDVPGLFQLLRSSRAKNIQTTVKSTYQLTLSLAFFLAFNLIFSFINLKTYGDTKLAELNIAQAIGMPVALLVQMAVNMKISSATFHSDKEFLRHNFFEKKNLAVLVLSSLYGIVFIHSQVLHLVFPHVQAEKVVVLFWPLMISQIFLGSTTILSTKEFMRGRKFFQLFVQLFSIIALILLSQLIPVTYYSTATAFSLACLSGTAVALLFSLRFQSKSPGYLENGQ